MEGAGCYCDFISSPNSDRNLRISRTELKRPRSYRLMSEAAQRPNAQIGQLAADEDERLALAAATAIQRLIADRNAVRSHAAAQERELTRLRRHIALIRDSYRRLTSEFTTQLQHIDSVVSSAIHEPAEPANLPHATQEKRTTELASSTSSGGSSEGSWLLPSSWQQIHFGPSSDQPPRGGQLQNQSASPWEMCARPQGKGTGP